MGTIGSKEFKENKVMKLIDKDKVVEEIEKIMNEQQEICKDDVANGEDPKAENISVIYHLQQFIKFLDTLETKDVDLEKELETLDSLLYDLDGVAVKGATSYLTVEDVKDIAKRFFELGLKAKKEIWV